ncbi:MAG: diphthine--ammonia ligase [Nitrososphaerota archaeon]|nr:diphthine--ammonia ligase [Nitrososphaerota archaeon]MDG6939218.1 diphthine--ammonia ligase [Nitrososphaerota archaeon]
MTGVRAAALFSGGKDSNYSLLLASKEGYDVACLLTLDPGTPESMLFHYPNVWVTRLQAEALKLPIVYEPIEEGGSETEALRGLVSRARKEFGFDVVVTGGLKSDYQRRAFGGVMAAEGVGVHSPLWGVDEAGYLHDLVGSGFRFIMTSVSAHGLGPEWLGRVFDGEMVERLVERSVRFGFNASLEGGEGETLVLDAPHYCKELVIDESETVWQKDRGLLKIKRASLKDKVDV